MRVHEAGRECQQQPGHRQPFGDRGGDGHGRPYSCGVRSRLVTVVMRVTRHFPSSRFISSRYDRYRNDGMFFETGLVATELVYTMAVAAEGVTDSTAVPSTDVVFVT